MTAVLLGSAGAEPAPETDTKAEFIERFARFVTWPESVAPGAGEPYVLGIVGTGEVSARLRAIVPSRKIRGHAIRLVEVTRLHDLEQCHIVVIEGTAAADLESIVAVTGEHPILTVAASPELAGRGPLIAFTDRDGHVGFTIDRDAVARSGLAVSVKLLRLGAK